MCWKPRRGIPISLGVLLLHIARRLGHDAQGINFPGHFLTRIDGVLVDPFAFQTLTEADCRNMLKGEPAEGAFEVASATMIALRMLNNVKYLFMDRARWERVLDILELQQALTPGAVQLRYEAGHALGRTRRAGRCRAFFSRSVAIAAS